jgi:acetolactate synthase-1/3 small subunit
VNTSLEQVIKVANQIEKQVDVLKAFYHADTEVVYQELALYKLPTNLNTGGEIEQILRQHQARILSLSPEFTTIEKTGRPEEINALFTDLKPFGVLEFAKSGRVAISKPMKTLEDYLKELE